MRRAWWPVLLVGLSGCLGRTAEPTLDEAAPGGGGLAIHWQVSERDLRQVTVEISGTPLTALPADSPWPTWFTVHVAPPAGTADNAPMLGDYTWVEDRLTFTPRFPLQPGLAYVAVVAAPFLSDPLTSRHVVPRPELKPATVVRHIYPSSQLLPENLLKFYLHFSAPMSRGRVYQHISLLDAQGKEVPLPFLELDEELWDAELTRLTLLIDPGRIKRGVRPLEEIGPALQTGQTYTLRIAKDWKDARGVPLKEAARKTFRVTIPDRAPPDPASWRMNLPQAGRQGALEVFFPEPMDHALALRVIRVRDETGHRLAGKVALAEEETLWRFVPDQTWKAGRYRLVVGTVLEDLAGNSVGRPFEVDLFERVEPRLTTEEVLVPFRVE